jgi:hypothetical protein
MVLLMIRFREPLRSLHFCGAWQSGAIRAAAQKGYSLSSPLLDDALLGESPIKTTAPSMLISVYGSMTRYCNRQSYLLIPQVQASSIPLLRC